MSTGFNEMFREYTQGFIQQNFMTAFSMVRPGEIPVEDGKMIFDLCHHMVKRHQFVTLEKWKLPPACDELPIVGYWVPQGCSCLVPANPGIRTYVFTPDFSGCSILVDQIDDTWYQVYHVQGGKKYLQEEYLPKKHGRGLAGAMTFEDYGNVNYPCGFAFLKYENKRWWIYYQRQNGAMLGLDVNKQFSWIGPPPAVLGGARIPVADLRSEIPRLGVKHSDNELPVTRKPEQVQKLPDIETWGSQVSSAGAVSASQASGVVGH